MTRRRPRRFSLAAVAVALMALATLFWTRGCRTAPRRPAPASSGDASLVQVTGYCNCGKCCGWERSWFGFGPPVYNYGPLKGRRKEVGITATGTTARHGTVAADPRFYPMGTRLRIPGYGEGVVEDVGGAIKGRHIDIWFPTHAEALAWGTRGLKVEVVAAAPRGKRGRRSRRKGR